jgi:methylmalonyl-CoA mutase C-terminal domain/subunit
MEVVYTGLYQTIPAIVQAAIQEDVDIIGLSILSGAHMPLIRKLMEALGEAGLNDKLVLVGGTIAAEDEQTMLDLGVAAVFPVGTPLSSVVHKVKDLTRGHHES